VLEGRFEGIDSLQADAGDGDGPIWDGSSAYGRACVRLCGGSSKLEGHK
jgi:hypothetical protein